MSTNSNTIVAQATADAASVPRKFDPTQQGVPSRKQKQIDRVEWENFDPDRVTAIFENNEGRAVLIGDDGQPDPQSSVSYEPSPSLMKRKAKIVGEGDAFKEVTTDGQKQKISRARAHFRAQFLKDISDETAKKYPDWVRWADVSYDKMNKTSMNLLRASMKWSHSDKWKKPIENAEKVALTFMESKLPAGSEDWDTLQKMTAIKQSPELFKQFEDRMFSEYVKGARYPTKPMKSKSGQPLPMSFSVESKVYATKDFAGGTYNKDAMGPSDVEIPSNTANIHKAIKAMAELPGPGGAGIDCREYSPIVYIDDRKDKGEKGYIIERKTIKLPGGALVPDYWYDPTRMHKGKPCQSYCTLVVGFVMTSSALGGYGVKLIWKERRVLKIIHREEIPERKMRKYANKRSLDEDSSSSDDEYEEPTTTTGGEESNDPKRARSATSGGAQQQQGSMQPPPAQEPQKNDPTNLYDFE